MTTNTMKKNIRLIFLCLVSVLFINMDCAEDNTSLDFKRVTMENKSGEAIYFYEFDRPFTPYETLYRSSKPFTLLPDGEETDNIRVVNEEGRMLYIFIYKQSTMDEYTKEELAERDTFDSQIVLTHDELVKNSFTIIYTGEKNRERQ